MVENIGHYRLLSRLGAGGMGEVYLALDLRLQRKVALKVLPEALRADGERLRRFEQEARAASAINHSHIAHIYEIGEDRGIRFIAMEYVEGETLDARFFTRKPSAEEFRSIVEQATQALAAAHARGIVHRDLKPGNIMINPEGEIKILDFGLAKPPSEAAGDAPVGGTPAYMSPEQALGQELDARTDIFSLGAVFYSLWTGVSPSEGGSSRETLAHLQDPEPFDLSLIPAEFRGLLARCLEKDRDKRCPSMRELAGGPLDEGQGRRGAWTKEALVATLLVVAAAGGWIFLHRGRSIESIAVVPFAALDQGSAALGQGIAEEFTMRLSALEGLQVKPCRNGKADPAAVGRQLGVGGVFSGTLAMLDGRISLSVDLYDGPSGRKLWGGRYERGRSEMLGLLDQLSREAAAELRSQPRAADAKALAQRGTENSEAFLLYLEGRAMTRRFNVGGMRKGLELLEQAIALDPSYARAYAAKSIAYIRSVNWLMPVSEAALQARDHAERALSLDDQLYEAHYALGYYSGFYIHDYERAAVEFRRGRELAPARATYYILPAMLLCMQQRFGEADRLMEAARGLEPDSAQITADAALVRYAAHRFDGAMELFDRAQTLDPGFGGGLLWRGNTLAELGRYDEAEAALRKAMDLAPTTPIRANLAHLLARAGRQAEARALLKKLLIMRDQEKGLVSPVDLSAIYVALGEHDKALEWLNRAVVEHGGAAWIGFDPHFDPLRGDERFRAVVRRLHLPESFPRT